MACIHTTTVTARPFSMDNLFSENPQKMFIITFYLFSSNGSALFYQDQCNWYCVGTIVGITIANVHVDCMQVKDTCLLNMRADDISLPMYGNTQESLWFVFIPMLWIDRAYSIKYSLRSPYEIITMFTYLNVGALICNVDAISTGLVQLYE